MISSHRIPPIAILCIFRGHSLSTSLGKRDGVDEESNTKWHRKEGVQSKKWCLPHKLFYVIFSVTQSLFLLGVSWGPGNITASNTNIIFAQKYYNSTTLLMSIVYTTCVSKNWIVSQDVFFYLLWYNAIGWSSHIRKKSSFLSFSSFFVKFSK